MARPRRATRLRGLRPDQPNPWQLERLRFGRNVQRLRESLNLTRSMLAVAIDSSYSTISSIERGQANCTLHTILALVRVFACSPSALID